MKSNRLPLALCSALALFVAGCGGGQAPSGDYSSEKKTSAPKTSTTQTAPTTGAADPTPAGGASTQPAAKTAGAAVSPEAMKEAQTIYGQRCAACHGANGKGDGLAAAALNPKPRDYTDKAWQASVTDEYIEKAILMGGTAVGKSPLMPPSPDLAGKPEVVKGLRQIIRDMPAK